MKYVVLLTFLGVILAVLLPGRAMTSPRAVEVNSPRTAAESYGKYCSSCHGKDGRAKTFKAKFNHARNLTDRSWQDSVSDERLFNSIMNGRGKSMPAYAKKLSQQEIDALVAFVRGLKK